MYQLLQVQRYNNLMLLQKKYIIVMTLGNGSMVDEPRLRGWVVYGNNSARYFSNRRGAELEIEALI